MVCQTAVALLKEVVHAVRVFCLLQSIHRACHQSRVLPGCLQGRPVLKLSQATALSLFKLDHFELVRCSEANVKCLVAWSSTSLVIAFRGTANLTNAFADIKVRRTIHLHIRNHISLCAMFSCASQIQ